MHKKKNTQDRQHCPLYIPRLRSRVVHCGPRRLTFALGQLENLSFFTEIICWAPWIIFSHVEAHGLPSIFQHSLGILRLGHREAGGIQILCNIWVHAALGIIVILTVKAFLTDTQVCRQLIDSLKKKLINFKYQYHKLSQVETPFMVS